MRVRGLYAVTDETCCGPAGGARIAAALAGGARLVQLRCKDRMPPVETVAALVALGHRFDALVLINDDVDMAQAARADGVHIGRDDVDLATARRRLGAKAVIGVSCYADLTRARDLARQGADYLAFGSFYPSRTKPHAVSADPTLLTRAREYGKPLVAIGGIRPENGAALIAAGASALAVVDGIFGQNDIERAARAYAQLFEETHDRKP